MENKCKDIELKSEEVQELMGAISPLILRIGISFFTLFLVLIIVLSAFIKYPEIITIPANASNCHWLVEEKSSFEGKVLYSLESARFVSVGDTIAALIHLNMPDTVYIVSHSSGIAFPYDLLQKNDFVCTGKTLCHIVDSVSQILVAKTYIDTKLKTVLSNGVEVTASVNDSSIKGQLVSIAENPNPNDERYAALFSFTLPSNVSHFIFWQKKISIRITLSDKTVFEKFVMSKFQMN